jgi:nucleotide-binding universal stress UspA family protein
MNNIMVVFSSTDIPKKLIDRSIKLAKERDGKLIILDVRDKVMGERVADITENLGFMGDKVVRTLRKQITQERCDVIFKKLSVVEDLAKKNNIPYEIIVEKGSFEKGVHKIARAKDVNLIIAQKSDKIPGSWKNIKIMKI